MVTAVPDGRLVINPNGSRRFVSNQRGGTSVSWNAAGKAVSVADATPSECGAEFDEYVKRALSEPFPYDERCPAFRDVHDLWNGRKLRLQIKYPGGSAWHVGQVKSWRQWNSGPFCPITFWSLEIKLDESSDDETSSTLQFSPGTLVEIEGLETTTQHNGKQATVKKYLEDTGRYHVCYGQKPNKTDIGINPANLKKVTVVSRTVSKVDIHNGGILESNGTDTFKEIQFEWLSPATPHINFHE